MPLDDALVWKFEQWLYAITEKYKQKITKYEIRRFAWMVSNGSSLVADFETGRKFGFTIRFWSSGEFEIDTFDPYDEPYIMYEKVDSVDQFDDILARHVEEVFSW